MSNQSSQAVAVATALDSGTDYHRGADAAASDVSAGTSDIVRATRLRPGDGGSATTRAVTIVP